jgi:hypothetical protein
MDKTKVGLKGEMPHAYVQFEDGTTIAVPLKSGENFPPIATVHVTTAKGRTTDTARLSVRMTTGQVHVTRADRNKPLERFLAEQRAGK